MLSVILSDNQEFTWHVGEKVPEIWQAKENVFPRPPKREVVEIQADGHELERVIETCTNIPLTHGRVVRWFGDHAKFIFHNLKP
jgi:hypothetical protein